jgi:hypothetical protein
MATQAEEAPSFPALWDLDADYKPEDHTINFKGSDYLNVQQRLYWFIRDQRHFMRMGLAKVPYIIRTELVELDREAGYAHFRTYVRDVLGNEATMYGSESARDFGDYAEKASTKSLGRAFLQLGYGTSFAPELDEGERIVDGGRERKGSQPAQGGRQKRQERPQVGDKEPVSLDAIETIQEAYTASQRLRVPAPRWTQWKRQANGDMDILRGMLQGWEQERAALAAERSA